MARNIIQRSSAISIPRKFLKSQTALLQEGINFNERALNFIRSAGILYICKVFLKRAELMHRTGEEIQVLQTLSGWHAVNT